MQLLNFTEKQKAYNNMWMDVANSVSSMSHCTRRKVGCVIVQDGRPISTGWNGTPAGFDNCCEDPSTGTTLTHTIHAEANALDKISRDGGLGAAGASLYVTTQPCIQCAVRIANNRISSVYYRDSYRDSAGLDFLNQLSIPTFQI